MTRDSLLGAFAASSVSNSTGAGRQVAPMLTFLRRLQSARRVRTFVIRDAGNGKVLDVGTFRNRLPPFSALLAFRAAATHDRVAKAAESLGVTESVVSHQVRQLESFLQTKLFDRSGGP